MTKFNPDNKDVLTYKECLAPAMAITEEEDAKQYFADYANFILTQNHGLTIGECEDIARSNLAFYAGYYDNEVRERVERLFSCKHPFFGAIAETGPKTSEEYFAMGMKWAEQNVVDPEKKADALRAVQRQTLE